MASRDPNLYVGNADTTIPDSNDEIANWDDELRQAKTQVQNSFPNVTGAVTATQDELNKLASFEGTVASTDDIAVVQSNVNTNSAAIIELDSEVAKTDVANTFTANQRVEGSVTATTQMFVGSDGGGDSVIDFYDDSSNAWRRLGWDDSTNDWRVEDNDSVQQRLVHSGNIASFESTQTLADLDLSGGSSNIVHEVGLNTTWTPAAGFYQGWMDIRPGLNNVKITVSGREVTYTGGDQEIFMSFFTDGNDVKVVTAASGNAWFRYKVWT